MAFNFQAYRNPYVGTIAELLSRGEDAKAKALIDVANAQAQAAQVRGQAYGGAVEGIGNIAARAIAEYNDPKAREARAIEKGQKVLNDRSRETITDSGQRLTPDTRVPGVPYKEFVNNPTVNPVDKLFRNVDFGAARPAVTTQERFSLAQPDVSGTTIENVLQVRPPGLNPRPNATSQDILGQIREGVTLPTGRAPEVETYDKAPRNRYTTAQGLYDVSLAYSDLIDAGTPMKVAIALAGQGQQANSIFAAYDKDKEALDQKQIAVRGSIANMALQLMDIQGMSAEDALAQVGGPAGNRLSQDDMNAFTVELHGKKTESEKRQMLVSEVDKWDAQGPRQAVAPGSVLLGASGNPRQVGTAPVSAADQLFSQNLRDYKKAVINGSTESSYANWLASEGRAPDKLTPNELALDSFAQSLGKKDRSSLTDADFQKYAKRQNLANDDPRMAMLRDLSIAAAQDKALTAQQVRDDAAAFNRLPTNVQNAASTIGLRMPSDVARNNLSRQLARAPDEASQLRLLRVAIIPAGEAGIRYASRQATIDALDVIQSTLAELRDMPGASVEGPLSGNLEKIAKAFGTSRNTKYQELGARIGNALINYRKGITGAAFSPEEAKGYKDLFSDYTNTPALTDAILSGFRSALKDDVISNYKMFLGGDESAESLARVLAEPNVSNSGSGRQIGKYDVVVN